MTKPRIIIIGGGPAGVLATGRSAECGVDALLIEKGPRLTRKLRITGKGRCNITNSADIREFIDAFGPDGKFLYGAFSRFFRDDILEILAGQNIKCKTERGGRIFPVSDQANDVADALEKWMVKSGARVKTGCKATSLSVTDGKISGVKVLGGDIRAQAVIITTGGLSYPKTGSTGEGYTLAREVGHTISPLRPALAPLVIRENWVRKLQGLSLKNINAKLIHITPDGKEKIITSEFGEMLFTHFGVSGPIILTISRDVPKALESGKVIISLDLKPALDEQQLHQRLIRDFKQIRHMGNYAKELLPKLLASELPALADIDPDKPVNHITSEERSRIINCLKNLRMTVNGMTGIEDAIVTAGGISLSEIDSKTMMSKIVPGLFFAGEVLDLDAKTGGYNLQAAFSTGYVAGQSAAEYALDL